jgi:hypothetical protein
MRPTLSTEDETMKASKARKHRTAFKTTRGNKRYLKRGADGRIIDNQSYKRAHGQDVRRQARGEK